MSRAGDCTLERLGTVPVEVANRLVFVTAFINGQPVDLVVDTGSDRTLLSRAAVARLGLGTDAMHRTRGWGLAGPTASLDAKVSRFELAGITLPLARVAVGDLSVKPLGARVDGVLGTDVLRRFDVDLDAPAGQLTLYRGESCRLKVPPWPTPAVAIAGVRGVNRTRQVPRLLLIPIEVDGVPGLALLDTGSQVSAVTRAFARTVGVPAARLRQDQTVIVGGAGPDPVTVPLHRFRLRIGPWIADDPVLPVLQPPEDPEPHVRYPTPPWQGLVGEDFLHGRRIWVSFTGWQVFISSSRAHRS